MWEKHHVTLRTFLQEWSREERAFYIGSALAVAERAQKQHENNNENNQTDSGRTISGSELMRRKAEGGA